MKGKLLVTLPSQELPSSTPCWTECRIREKRGGSLELLYHEERRGREREGGRKIDKSSSWSSILHRLSWQATPTHRCWIRCCWAWQPWRPFWPWPLLESWRRSTGSTPPVDPEVQSTLPSYASRLMQVQPPQCTLRPSRRSMTSIRTSYRTSMVSLSIIQSLEENLFMCAYL